MANGNIEAADRRSGRVPLSLTALLLIGAGAVLLWLHLTDRLAPLVAGAPSIVIELPAGSLAGSGQAGEAAPAATPAASIELAPEAPGEPDPEAASEPAVAELSEPLEAPPAAAEPQDPAPPPAAIPPAVTPPSSEPVAPAPEASAEPPPAPPAPEPVTPGAPPPAQAELQADAAPPMVPAPQLPGDEPETAQPAPEAPPPAAPPPEEETAAAGDEPAPPAAPATEAAEPEAIPDEPDAAPDGAAGPAENPQVAFAWQRLARPFPPDETRPRIAVVVAGLGLSEAATTAAIQQLPAEITLSFSPYSNRLEEYVAMARAAGHEVLLDLPMEPASFPRDDPGPQALLTSLSEDANADRLAWTLGRTDGYLGVATYMGSRFTTSEEHLRPVMEELDRRGLLMLDSRAAADSLAAELAAEEGVAHAINDRFIDNEASRVAIDGRLQQVERIARGSGAAVAMGYAYPVTIERLSEWARGLSGKGLTLAPISAVANRQEVR